eukprot:TRINITY_DN13770_c0_g1_i4.p1 TRINITY_DN13770_c0_g1~~TRINITY_DN13770_c0_g1_i4.p1  ORF type:complete len:196 (-),score=13.92 TRINITY_DN13770_c0_g1_i4:366-953(-)
MKVLVMVACLAGFVGLMRQLPSQFHGQVTAMAVFSDGSVRWKRSNAGTAPDVAQASSASSSDGNIVIEESRPPRNDEGSIVSDEDRSDDFDTCVHLFRGDWTLIEGDVGSRFRQLSFNGILVTLADSSGETLTRSSSGEVLLKGARLFLEGELLVRVRGNGSACKYRRGLPVTQDDGILVSDDEDSGKLFQGFLT